MAEREIPVPMSWELHWHGPRLRTFAHPLYSTQEFFTLIFGVLLGAINMVKLGDSSVLFLM